MKNKDQIFLNMAYLIAAASKDPSTKIGAVVVGPDDEVRSLGYNGFPRGIYDNVDERFERPEKYYWFAHAERNAVYNAARMGLSLKDCKMYTSGIPCTDCAIAIIQSGIKEVIVDLDWDKDEDNKWSESARRTVEMLHEAGVELKEIEFSQMTIRRWKRGQAF